VFCANASDGIFTAHPKLKGEQLKDIKGEKGFPLGKEVMEKATEGKISEVTYWWPRSDSDKPLTPSSRRLEIKSAPSATTNSWPTGLLAAHLLTDHTASQRLLQLSR